MSKTEKDPLDPRGLIFESYAIDGITAPECRSIFLDWALGLAADMDESETVNALLARYSEQHSDHPMTKVLQEALRPAAQPRRRGARAGRRSDTSARAIAAERDN